MTSKRAPRFVVERAAVAASRSVAIDESVDTGNTARERQASRRRGATTAAAGVPAWNDGANASEEC